MTDTMSRGESVWNYICELTACEDPVIERSMTVNQELAHAAGTARLAQLLALRRNLDSEMAFIVGVLHDIGRIITGIKKDHARTGMDFARVYLVRSGDFSPEKIENLVNAVGNHSLKDQVGTPLEELIKDADVLDGYFSGRPSSNPESVSRLERLLGELDIKNQAEY